MATSIVPLGPCESLRHPFAASVFLSTRRENKHIQGMRRVLIMQYSNAILNSSDPKVYWLAMYSIKHIETMQYAYNTETPIYHQWNISLHLTTKIFNYMSNGAIQQLFYDLLVLVYFFNSCKCKLLMCICSLLTCSAHMFNWRYSQTNVLGWDLFNIWQLFGITVTPFWECVHARDLHRNYRCSKQKRHHSVRETTYNTTLKNNANFFDWWIVLFGVSMTP